MLGKPALPTVKRAGGLNRTLEGLGGRATAAIAWILSVLVVEAVFGASLATVVRPLEYQHELRLKDRNAPASEPRQRERTHEDSIEPWELVSV